MRWENTNGMASTCCRLLLVLIAFATAPALRAGEPLSLSLSISEAIDHAVNQQLQEKQITPASTAAEEIFLRRLMLDLAGRIPTAAEVGAYLDSSVETKRADLTDHLLASPDFALHQRNEMERLLMPGLNPDEEFRKYLLEAVRENRAWDQMFREMLLANVPGSEGFLKARVSSVDSLTNDTSRIFFGVSINCAQCHDHPLVDDWKQDHYFGLQSFFSRTYLTKKKILAEKFSGEVKFKTTAGEEKQARFMFLTGATMTEPPLELSDEQRKEREQDIQRQMKDADAPPPTPPEFSPRAALVELALASENNSFFARSIVNRTWGRLMGHALVDPPDQMHSANSASHPELLDWLARDLIDHGYDLKRLLRGIVLSDTYARSSRWSDDLDLPWPGHHAVAIPRPLTPHQFALTLVIATRNPEQLAADISSERWAKRREDLERESTGIVNQFENPSENFQVSVDEALYFNNNDRVQTDLLRDAPDRLIGYLKTTSDRSTAITAAFRVVLSRAPDADELATFEKYLAERAERPTEGLQQVVWALLTSPEMRFNH